MSDEPVCEDPIECDGHCPACRPANEIPPTISEPVPDADVCLLQAAVEMNGLINPAEATDYWLWFCDAHRSFGVADTEQEAWYVADGHAQFCHDKGSGDEAECMWATVVARYEHGKPVEVRRIAALEPAAGLPDGPPGT